MLNERPYLVRAIVKYGQYWVCVWFSYLLHSCCLCCVCLASAYQALGYDNDSSKHQLHKHTHTHNLKASTKRFGLVNVARMTSLNENVYFFFSQFFFTLTILSKLKIEKTNKVNIVEKMPAIMSLLSACAVRSLNEVTQDTKAARLQCSSWNRSWSMGHITAKKEQRDSA